MSKNKKTSNNENQEKKAIVNARNLVISTKNSVEIANMIRNKNTSKAKTRLEEVISMKKAVPYRRFDREVAHKREVGPGKYPVNACIEILKLIKSAEANARNLGMNQNLCISSIIVNKGPKQWHPGRQRRRRMKNTNIQIILTEIKTTSSKKIESKNKNQEKEKIESKAKEQKKEIKKEVKKEK